MSDSISNELSGLGDADMDTIIDYVTGELDPAAVAAIEARMASDAVFARAVASYQTLWQTPLPTPPRNLAAAWTAIEQKVAAQTTAAAAPLPEHPPLATATPDRRKPASWTRWIVAPQLLVMAVFAFFMYWSFIHYKGESALQRRFRYYAATNHPRTITLADQSQVTLAPGGLLVADNLVPDAETGKPRVVHLAGNGTFVVHADPRHPFIVESYGISAVAIGTTFSVGTQAAANEGGGEEGQSTPMPAAPSQELPPSRGIHVTVVNGKVVVRRQMADGKQETIAVLGPGQETSVQTFLRNFQAGWDAGKAGKSIPEAYMEARALVAAESVQAAMMKKHGQ